MPTEDTGSGTARRTIFRTGAGVGIAALGAATLVAGSTTAQAEETTTGAAPAPAVNPAFPKYELRASWIASTVNIDWPSRPGLDVATQKAELVRWLDEAVAYGFNAVMFQIRPTADAFWPSPHEPWSRWLTGSQGVDPGYDPLEYAVAEAHKRGLEIHGWFNPFRISMASVSNDVGIDPSKLVDGHPAKDNPDWVVAYPADAPTSGKLYYDPGVPAARQHNVDAICHAAENYDLDGVHFDDYFYPYPVGTSEFLDDASFAEYGGDYTDKKAWRRNNVDEFVKAISDRLRRNRPGIKFGISPFGVWRNKADDPVLGSDTAAGAPTYDVLFADTRKWVLEEWIDYIVPQVYWADSLAVASYGKIVRWWDEVCRGTNVQLFIGEATYKVNASTQSPEWNNDAHELDRHVVLGRELGDVDGNIYFSAKSVRANELNAMGIIRDAHYQRPALIPPSDDRQRRPDRPEINDARWRDGKLELRFGCGRGRGGGHGHGRREATWYAVWRFDGHRRDVDAGDIADATALVGRVHADADGEFVDATAVRGRKYTYAVTAYNQNWTESKISKARKV
ncbi:family 10 glycosylhydrolase [Phytomonospora sp. NPDC050363]|uniref:glycoside hydrolase family 10 protein n=1 Tax=Phytomonospora sp. NPDC050363 TaxID=3155642 RepID=UPI0033C1EA0C